MFDQLPAPLNLRLKPRLGGSFLLDVLTAVPGAPGKL